MYKLFAAIGFIFLLSCNKKSDTNIPFSEATYTMTVTLNWENPQFAVPLNAHVTPLIGMIHSKDTFLWKPATLATPGLEYVAEIGVNTKMDMELDAILAAGKALSKFIFTQPTSVTGTIQNNITLNTDYPLISFASMLAPSPDWFMGIHDYNLLVNGKWMDNITIDLFAYDAGTEDGDIFSYDNPDSNPHINISLLSPSNASVLANGNSSIGSIGTITFVKN